MKINLVVLTILVVVAVVKVQCDGPKVCTDLTVNCTGSAPEGLPITWKTRQHYRVKKLQKLSKGRPKHILWGSGKMVESEGDIQIALKRKDGKRIYASCLCVYVSQGTKSVRISGILFPIHILVGCTRGCEVCTPWGRGLPFGQLSVWIRPKEGVTKLSAGQLYISTCRAP